VLIFGIRRVERASRANPATAGVTAEEVADAPGTGASVATEIGVGTPDDTRRSLRAEVSEGLHFVLRNRYLRSIAASTGTSNLFNNIAFAIYPVFVYVQLGVTPQTVGLIGGGFGAGALLGAVTATRVANRLGVGRAIVVSIAVAGPSMLLVPLASHDTALVLIGSAGFIGSWGSTVYNVNQVSLRQAITPEPMLGRMNATMRFIVWGTIPIGQIIGGLIATTPLGVIGAIWIGAIGESFAFLAVLLSPVRSLQTIPEPEAA
jgi:predicted MFS family arabinose efflux permease